MRLGVVTEKWVEAESAEPEGNARRGLAFLIPSCQFVDSFLGR